LGNGLSQEYKCGYPHKGDTEDDNDDDDDDDNTLTITEVENPQTMLSQQNHLRLCGKQKEIQMGIKNVPQLYKKCINECMYVCMSHLMILKWCQENTNPRDSGLEGQMTRQEPMKEHC
jgi:hypothetical protein